MPVVGFLNAASPDTNTDRVRAFRQGLKEVGFIEGENVAVEYRWAENQFDRLPTLAAELVRRQVAVIVATGGSIPALAAKAATTTVPIVFTVPEDPVRSGLVASLARPGGNATGINFFSVELVAKRLEILREMVPATTRIAVLINPTNAADIETTMRDVAAAARAMGLQIQVLKANTSHEIDAAFATFVRERPDALLVSGGRQSRFQMDDDGDLHGCRTALVGSSGPLPRQQENEELEAAIEARADWSAAFCSRNKLSEAVSCRSAEASRTTC
jgi:ABC-type uncharacterized transport system substrate-binding protein